MGFSGKPSKGCLPCRQKRTKCDLALPACSQCIRKNRVCSGYRNEQDLLFRNETKLVVRKVNRKTDNPPEQSLASNSSAPQLSTLSTQQLSRRAALHDEAVLHFFAHYNEKLFESRAGTLDGGFNYVLSVFQSDAVRAGPVSEIIAAAGLAALGNMKAAPDLVTAARAKQVKVLRALNEQLQNPKTCLSDSSILTCLLLGTFESIMSDDPQSQVAQTFHLKGAMTLVQMRGRDRFADDVGHGIYARMRGAILAHCVRVSEPLPDFILSFLGDDGISQRDFQPFLYKLLGRLCQLRYDQKTKGIVDNRMFREAQSLLDEFSTWSPGIPEWHAGGRPSVDSMPLTSNADETYRLIWLATTWIFQQTARIVASDVFIEGARGQALLRPGLAARAILNDAINTQLELVEELKESLAYYLHNFKASQSTMKTVGGYMLLWGLSGMSSASTCSEDTFLWMTNQAETIAEGFGLRQGRMLAEFLRKRARVPPVEEVRSSTVPSTSVRLRDAQQGPGSNSSLLSIFGTVYAPRQNGTATRIHRPVRQGKGVSQKGSEPRT